MEAIHALDFLLSLQEQAADPHVARAAKRHREAVADEVKAADYEQYRTVDATIGEAGLAPAIDLVPGSTHAENLAADILEQLKKESTQPIPPVINVTLPMLQASPVAPPPAPIAIAIGNPADITG